MSTPPGNTVAAPSLKRTLGLWDLVLYGIIVIQPTAPMPGYGVFANASQGQVVTCILIGMVAMVFTAISYGRMAFVLQFCSWSACRIKRMSSARAITGLAAYFGSTIFHSIFMKLSA